MFQNIPVQNIRSNWTESYSYDYTSKLGSYIFRKEFLANKRKEIKSPQIRNFNLISDISCTQYGNYNNQHHKEMTIPSHIQNIAQRSSNNHQYWHSWQKKSSHFVFNQKGNYDVRNLNTNSLRSEIRPKMDSMGSKIKYNSPRKSSYLSGGSHKKGASSASTGKFLSRDTIPHQPQEFYQNYNRTNRLINQPSIGQMCESPHNQEPSFRFQSYPQNY